MASEWSGGLRNKRDDLPNCHNDYETARLHGFATSSSPQALTIPERQLRNPGSTDLPCGRTRKDPRYVVALCYPFTTYRTTAKKMKKKTLKKKEFY